MNGVMLEIQSERRECKRWEPKIQKLKKLVRKTHYKWKKYNKILGRLARSPDAHGLSGHNTYVWPEKGSSKECFGFMLHFMTHLFYTSCHKKSNFVYMALMITCWHFSKNLKLEPFS